MGCIMGCNPIPPRQRKERRMFSAASDDTAMMKQVQATHAPDGREVDVKPIIQIVEEILIQAIARSSDGDLHGKRDQEDAMEKAAALAEFDMPDNLSFVIDKICCELSCKCSGGGDAHGTTMALLNTLSSYPWHAKVVLTLAAFSVNVGEFWLVAQLCASNTLAKSVSLLKQLPDLAENSNSLRPQFDAINKLVKAALDVTKIIVEFKELPSQYISESTPPLSVASTHIPIAVYWTIRSMVACSSQISSLVGLRNENVTSTTETQELSILAHEVNNIYEHLRNQLAICNPHMEDKKDVEANENPVLVGLFKMVHTDNMKILKALVYAKEEQPPLLDCSSKTKVSPEVLRRKHVLLLISDLDISPEEILVLDNLYRDARARNEIHYEIVWIPVEDRSNWNEQKQTKFEQLLSNMIWFSVRHPLIIDPAVIKHIKEVWNFTKRTILVVLDPQGRLSSPNALNMIWIWGNLAFPFTHEKEESLWKEEIWSLELLVDGIDPNIPDWITEGRLMCLYGGQDLEWIKTFTTNVMAVSKAGNFNLEMVYVGKNNAKEQMQRMIDTFRRENYSHFWPSFTSIWFFWARLESMFYSKLHQGRTVEDDKIMSEVMSVLSYDGSDQGWAIFCRGPSEMARANGDNALTSMKDFPKWQEDVPADGFVPALQKYLNQIQIPHHCNRLILPASIGGIPERVVCAECGRQMERYFMYRCCVE